MSSDNKYPYGFWTDTKHIESVFKILAYSSGSAVLVRIVSGSDEVFGSGLRNSIAFLLSVVLISLIFRFAEGTLLHEFDKYRTEVGRPLSRREYIFVCVLVVLLAEVFPIILIFGSIPK